MLKRKIDDYIRNYYETTRNVEKTVKVTPKKRRKMTPKS